MEEPFFLSHLYHFVWVMVFNATFNNISVISWQSALLMEETGVPRENHRHVAIHWPTLSHNVVLSTLYTSLWAGFKLTTLVMMGTDCILGSCKSNNHMIIRPLLDKKARRSYITNWPVKPSTDGYIGVWNL